MATPLGTEDPAPSAGKVSTTSDGQDGARPKMITEEEFERRIRGKAAEAERAAKALESAQAKLAKIEADSKARDEAALTEQGKHKELAEVKTSEAKTLREQLKERDERIAAYEATEKARIEAIDASNKTRMKALPDDVREDVPKGLAPEALAGVLTAFEKRLVPRDEGDGVFGGGPRPKVGPAQTADQRWAASAAGMGNAMMGRLPSRDRGVQK